jgi:hypothetical protein
MRTIRRLLGAGLTAVVAFAGLAAVAPTPASAMVLPDRGWAGPIALKEVSGSPTNGTTFDIHLSVDNTLVAPDTIRFPNPDFNMGAHWTLDFTNAGTDVCVINGELKQYPWSQQGSSSGNATVRVGYADPSDPMHYAIGVGPEGGNFKVTAADGDTTPCATHPAFDTGYGAFSLPIGGSPWGTDTSGYAHITGGGASGIITTSWDLSRTADLDGDHISDSTDPCPLDPQNACGDACSSVGAQRLLFHPFYVAKVDVFRAPDVDLFHYQPSATACWNGTKADWQDQGASVYGDTDGGLDEILLNQLGFDLVHDPTKDFADTAGDSPTAEFSAEFYLAFHPLTLIDKLGVKKRIEDKVTPAIAGRLLTVISKYGVGNVKFSSAVQAEASRLTQELRDAALQVPSKLKSVGVPDSLADSLGDWVKGKVKDFNQDFTNNVNAMVSDPAFLALNSQQMAEALVAKFFQLLDPAWKLLAWRPDYKFTVSPSGNISFDTGPDHYINPLLIVEQKS